MKYVLLQSLSQHLWWLHFLQINQSLIEKIQISQILDKNVNFLVFFPIISLYVFIQKIVITQNFSLVCLIFPGHNHSELQRTPILIHIFEENKYQSIFYVQWNSTFFWPQMKDNRNQMDANWVLFALRLWLNEISNSQTDSLDANRSINYNHSIEITIFIQISRIDLLSLVTSFHFSFVQNSISSDSNEKDKYGKKSNEMELIPIANFNSSTVPDLILN